MITALEGYLIYGFSILVRDPDIFSFRGVIAFAIIALASIGYVPIVRRLWKSSWRFIVTDDRLLAVHQFLKTRVEVKWDAIVAVRELPTTLGARSAALKFNAIVTNDGREIVFAPHLSQYSQFLRELKTRATACRVFSPQLFPHE